MKTDASEERLSKYELIRLLGSGAMGDVYLARDTALHRLVAIKFVSSGQLPDPSANARLLREARAAAALDHPGICAIYEVHVDSLGRTCIVMQYVEGETLAQRLAQGPMDPAAALELGAAVADALAVAHARGIVHRDLKPQNIMVMPDGRPRLLDFGIAQVEISPEAAAAIATHTSSAEWSPGALVGTPAYMSPEQVLRKPIDGRSDLFSLGAVLFECLTARPAFQADNLVETWARVVYMNPPPPSSLNPAVPRAVDASVARLLAKDVSARVATAREAAQALHDVRASAFHALRRRTYMGLAAAATVAILGVGGLFAWRALHSPSAAGTKAVPAVSVIGVLPLTNLSADPSLDYVGAGLADTITTMLSSIEGLSVVSRAEVHDALQRNPETSRLCRALGLTYAVTGGDQQSAGRFHITVNVLTGDGRTIVAGGGRIYDEAIENLFELERRIAEDLSTQIIGRLSTTQRARLGRSPTESVQAMSAYWRGRALMEKPGPEPIDPAIAAFSEATTLDSGFALGYAGLGTAYWRKYLQTRESLWAGKATETTEHARQLDPDRPEVRLAMATVYNGVGRTEEAAQEAQSVLQLQPASYDAHHLISDIRAARGEIDQAIAASMAALRIRPDYPQAYRSLGILQLRAGRYDAAADTFRKMTTLQPDSPFPFQLLGNAHAASGDLASAERDYSEALSRGGSFATHSSLGFVYYMQGRFDNARDQFLKAIELRPKSATTHWNIGDAYRHLGRQGDADKAYRDAIALFDEDIRVNSRDAESIATRATCHARLRQIAEARADSMRAARIAPADQDVLYQRALVATIAGDRGEAIAMLRQAVAAGYSVALLQLDPDLSSLREEPEFQSLVGTALSTRRTK